MPNRNRGDQQEPTPPMPPAPAIDAAIRGKGRVDQSLDRTLSDIRLKRGDSVREARNAHLRHFGDDCTAPGSRKR